MLPWKMSGRAAEWWASPPSSAYWGQKPAILSSIRCFTPWGELCALICCLFLQAFFSRQIMDSTDDTTEVWMGTVYYLIDFFDGIVQFMLQGWKMYRTVGPWMVPENFEIPRKYFQLPFVKYFKLGCTWVSTWEYFALYCTSFCISWSKAENSWKKVAMVQCRTEKQKMFRKPMHKLIKKLKQMSKLILDKGEKPPLDIRKCKMPIKQNHLNTSHIFRTRRGEILMAKYMYDITQWRKDMNIIFE